MRNIRRAVITFAVSVGLVLLSALPALADTNMFHHG